MNRDAMTARTQMPTIAQPAATATWSIFVGWAGLEVDKVADEPWGGAPEDETEELKEGMLVYHVVEYNVVLLVGVEKAWARHATASGRHLCEHDHRCKGLS
jgi:hypothetical protein